MTVAGNGLVFVGDRLIFVGAGLVSAVDGEFDDGEDKFYREI